MENKTISIFRDSEEQMRDYIAEDLADAAYCRHTHPARPATEIFNVNWQCRLFEEK